MTTSIVRLNNTQIARFMSDLCELLRDVVDNGASVNFVAPLDEEINRAWWRNALLQVEDGSRIVVAAVTDERVVGCAHLTPATAPNGHHRAEVQKVLVHSQFRRRGIAQALMAAIEDEARKLGRWLLVLDTEEGSAAELLYEKLGYLRAGGVPEFALNAAGTAYRANVYFYKRLSGVRPAES